MTSDTFIEEAYEWRTEMWSIIRKRPDVIFYILTKRVPHIAECLPDDWGDGYENVDLNMTCENQRAFDERWPIFRDIPAKHKGINLAPFLGETDITPALASGQIENVNLGGHFVKDGRMYHLDSQELQGMQAFRSGLSHFFRKPKSRIIIIHWPMPKPVQQ